MKATTSARITGLFFYPVKSCHGTALERAELCDTGIVGDRAWLVIRETGEFLTQRNLSQMALIEPRLEDGRLTLRTRLQPNAYPMADLTVPPPEPGAVRRTTQVWGSACETIDLGNEAAEWLTSVLGERCRLVTMAPGFVRQVDPRYSRPGDQVSFVDGFPLLLTTESSLEELNRLLLPSDPVPMSRFRPSVVISGAPPFAEDEWTTITVPAHGITLRVVKPCGRCIVTTTDQETGVRVSDEPLATLTRFRLVKEPGQSPGAMFGQNLIHDRAADSQFLEVGDELICS